MSIVELYFFFFFGVTLTFQWEFNFKDSLNIAGLGEKLDFVCTLDAMVRKLIPLICFDIFQSKWYRNALIGVPDDKSNSKKKRSLWQTPYVWLTLSWTTTNKCNIGREKKKGETYRIGSALRQGEVKTLQHSSYTMWWFHHSIYFFSFKAETYYSLLKKKYISFNCYKSCAYNQEKFPS